MNQNSFSKNYIIPVEKDIDYIEDKKNVKDTKTNKIDAKGTTSILVKQKKIEIEKGEIDKINLENNKTKSVNSVTKLENESNVKTKIENVKQNKKEDTLINKKHEPKNNNVNSKENEMEQNSLNEQHKEKDNKNKKKLRELTVYNGEIIENKYVNNIDYDSINSIDLINEIEQNIISKEKNTNYTKENIEIKKGEWNTKDIIKMSDSKNNQIERIGAKFKITSRENNKAKKIEELRKIAYKAYKNHEYEIAVKYYKDILKIDPNDNLSKLSLATSYHALKQYRQAKPIYIELIKVYPDNENIVSNLISIIVDESPYEAIYIIPSISEKYENSASIQAQASMAFTKVKNYEEAIKYIDKALSLDRDNILYLYNMGVLYDLSGNYKKALRIYKDVLTNIDNNSNIKRDKLLERVQILSNLNK